MTVINTNVKALYTQSALKASGRQHAVAMQQLSTGKRINSAKDDAAGLAIAAHMTAKIRSMNQAIRNAGDAVSLIQTAEGATNTMSDMIQRMSELTIQASNATYSPEQRGFLDLEFQQLKQEISRVSEMHEWNGFPILSGAAGSAVGPKPVYKVSSEGSLQTGMNYAPTNITTTNTGKIDIAGAFSKSGTVSLAVSSATPGVVTATLTLEDGTKTALTGTASNDNKTLTFASTALSDGVGSIVIKSGAAFTSQSLQFSVTRSVNSPPALQAGDLVINGKAIGPSFAQDDKVSPSAISNVLVLGGTKMNGNGMVAAATAPANGIAVETNLVLTVGRTSTGAISYAADSDAKAIAAAVNTAAGETGIIATATNTANFSLGGPATIGMKLIGGTAVADGTNSATITGVVITDRNDLSALLNAINGQTGTTGITASFASPTDKSAITLTGLDGRDIRIEDFTHNSAAISTTQGTGTASSGSLEYSAITMGSLSAGQTATVNGLTFTAGSSGASAADVAKAFSNIASNAAAATVNAAYSLAAGGSANVKGTLSGTFTAGFATGPASGNTVTATSTATGVQTDIATDVDAIPATFAGVALHGNSATSADSATKTGTVTLTSTKGAIEASQVNDDVFSSILNAVSTSVPVGSVGVSSADGSAIAKAAAINRETATTHVSAVVNPTVMTGTAMTGTTEVSGTVTINGIVSAPMSTTLSNTGESRASVVRAINAISDRTGVIAIDTGSASAGVRLEAADGRNIEVAFNTLATAANFAASTGLTQGAQAGSFSLANGIEEKIDVATRGERTGLQPGSYTQNQTALTTIPRAIAANAAGVSQLGEGDLVINGVGIRAAVAYDDQVSQQPFNGTLSSSRAASAIATASAINAAADKTGVRATVNGATTIGDTTTVGIESGDKYLYINGIAVKVNLSTSDSVDQRQAKVVAAINGQAGQHGVQASDPGPGAGIQLTTKDGRNLSVWYDSADTSLSAASFGLGRAAGTAPGVVGASGANAAYTGAPTVYGTVTLSSERPFKLEPGPNGYGSQGDFKSLGFAAGTYGGAVDETRAKMPGQHVGRLSFQVGAGANQTITIDLPDFGKNGSITGEITRDVDDPESKINIKTVENANAVLDKLTRALDKVNATRATMGAVMNRLEHVIDNLTNVSVNSEASRSQIEDANYAAASTELARTQIMQQAATAVLAQANTDTQTVMKLLQ